MPTGMVASRATTVATAVRAAICSGSSCVPAGSVAEMLDDHGDDACILHGMQIGKGAVDDLRHIPAVIHRAGQCQRVDHADDAFLFQ